MNAQLQPKKPRVMESLGFLIGSIAVGVTIAIVMLVHAVHGNGQDPNAELEQYSYNLGYQSGSPGGIAYAITERSGGPISACQATQLAAYVWADDDFRMDPSQYFEGCYAALTDQGMR